MWGWVSPETETVSNGRSPKGYAERTKEVKDGTSNRKGHESMAEPEKESASGKYL